MTIAPSVWTLPKVLLAGATVASIATLAACTNDDSGSRPPQSPPSSAVDNGQTGSPGARDTCSAETWRGPDATPREANCATLVAEPDEGVFTFYCSCDIGACGIDRETGAPLQSCATAVSVVQDNTRPCPRALQQACGVQPGWIGFCKGAGIGGESVCWPSGTGTHTCRCPGSNLDVHTNEPDCQKASEVCVPHDAAMPNEADSSPEAQGDAGSAGSPGARDTCASEIWRGPENSTLNANCGVLVPEAQNDAFMFYCSCDLDACGIDRQTGVPQQSCAKTVSVKQDNTRPCPRALQMACNTQVGWTGFCKGAGVGSESTCWPDDAGVYTCRCPGADGGVPTGERDCVKASAICLLDSGVR